MRMGRISTAAAVALSMIGTPVMAQAASPASKLSVAGAVKSSRAGAPMKSESDLRGGSVILGVAAVALVAIGIYFITKNGDDPSSP